jgi:hypothetical protein
MCGCVCVCVVKDCVTYLCVNEFRFITENNCAYTKKFLVLQFSVSSSYCRYLSVSLYIVYLKVVKLLSFASVLSF